MTWLMNGLRWMRQDLREYLCFMVGHDWNTITLKPCVFRENCRRCCARAPEWDRLLNDLLDTPLKKMFIPISVEFGKPLVTIPMIVKPSRPYRADVLFVGGSVLRPSQLLFVSQEDLDDADEQTARAACALLHRRVESEIERQMMFGGATA